MSCEYVHMHPVPVVENVMLYVGVLSMGIMCMRGCYCPRPADLIDTPTLSSEYTLVESKGSDKAVIM